MTTQEQPQAFTGLPLKAPLLNNLATLDYTAMTPIQAATLPLMLKNGDVIAQAKTGSGKTVAFGLSILNCINIDQYAVQALVLCPTRELAEQVCQVLRQLARLMHNVKVLNLSGGIPLRPQLDSLRHGAHIIVGTPGRVQKHITGKALALHTLKTLVLDEADRMLDMGFFDAIKEIIEVCPTKRQTLLFSATYPAEIKQLASQFMNHPEKIAVEDISEVEDIEQLFFEVKEKEEKFDLLKSLLFYYRPLSTLIFCNTKEQTTQLSRSLNKAGFSAIALNGDMEQFDRDQAMIRFTNQSISILVATDVAARGLDIKDLPAVINYELAFEHDVHIHRIGRTGRAGSKGVALSLTTPADAARLCLIEDGLAKPLTWGDRATLKTTNQKVIMPDMVTICLNAGKKDKIRPGDILGALTKDAGLPGDMIGKINIGALYSYVAIHHSQIDRVNQYFQNGKLKGRKVNAKQIGE